MTTAGGEGGLKGNLGDCDTWGRGGVKGNLGDCDNWGREGGGGGVKENLVTVTTGGEGRGSW